MAITDQERPATRLEVADAVRHLFDSGPISRETMVATARGKGARPEVVHALEGLPPRRFSDLRLLWGSMPTMEIGGRTRS